MTFGGQRVNVKKLIQQLRKLPSDALVCVALGERIAPAQGCRKLLSQSTTVLPGGVISVDSAQGEAEAVIFSADVPWGR